MSAIVSTRNSINAMSTGGGGGGGGQQARNDLRNKYNTLTVAEAKRLSRHMNGGRRPIRTASVLHKPRAPPTLLPDQDLDHQPGAKTAAAATGVRPRPGGGSRCASSCSNTSANSRLHTMSVDLGHHPSGLRYSCNSVYGTLQRTSTIYRTPPNSIGSSSNNNSPTESGRLQFDSNRAINESFYSAKSDCKSASKASLTSSTSKALKDQFSSLRRFFRFNPTRRTDEPQRQSPSTKNGGGGGGQFGLQHQSVSCDQNSLSGQIAELCLNRSQSPPVCPPPPGELKSMQYMENSVTAASGDNYSNYDEFTNLRNQRNSTLLLNNARRANNQTQTLNSNYHPQYQYHQDSSLFSEQNDTISVDQPDSWQMTSLPVSYERNLTTVAEERQQHQQQQNSREDLYSPVNFLDHLIKPPENFVDSAGNSSSNCTGGRRQPSDLSHSSSNQSLTSVTTTDSVLDFHRQTGGTAFRFSYGQPNAYDNGQQQHNNDASLPPRMPSNESAIKPTTTTDYGTCLDNDGDTTLLSDSSTLHGDSAGSSRCAELERTIESLKDKLIAKERELTDLQLKQWSSDYLIDQLKSAISRLEKENAQLRKNVMIDVNNRVNL